MARKTPKLTKLQKRVAEEYIKDLNGTQAYQRAGGKAKDARAAASEILTNPNVKEYVKQLKAERSEETKIDAQLVLTRLFEGINADLSDLYYEAGGLKPVHEWPEVWRKGLVAGLDVEQQYVYEDGERVPDGYITKIRLVDRTKLMKMLGEHTDVQAFIKNLNFTADDGLAEKIAKARQRANGSG